MDIGIVPAFVAGLISFVSPCVLPLVPAYIGYLGGTAATTVGTTERNSYVTFLHAIFFVLGFTAIFVLLGLALDEVVYKAIAPSLWTLAAKDFVLAIIVLHLVDDSLRSHNFSWLSQRVTAALMALFTLAVIVQVLLPGEMGYDKWAGIFSRQWMKVLTFVVIVSLLMHVWVGMRDILMDYVKSVGARLALQVATIVWLVGCAGWAIQVLWRL